MKKLTLLITHLGSGSENLSLNMKLAKEELVYDHPDIVNSVLDAGYDLNQVVYNYQISHKFIYKICNFVYYVRNPRFIQNVNFMNYYIFRLRRIYEIYKEAGGKFLKCEDENRGLSLKEAEKAYELFLYRVKKVDKMRG